MTNEYLRHTLATISYRFQKSVKDANFSKYWNDNSNIKYADQALEFGVDSLSEDLSVQNLASLDN